MTALVLPEPRGVLDVADVSRLSAQIVAWAEDSNDLAAVRDAADRWAAITAYVKRTSNEGVAEAEGALRRLEVRIGKLLGPAVNGGDRKSDQFRRDGTDLERHTRYDLRTLAEHADVVENVIASSDDMNPPSRRKCLTAINAHLQAEADAAVAAIHADAAPRIAAALATMTAIPSPDWIVTLRFRSMYRTIVDAEIEMLSGPRGWRKCRTCDRQRSLARYHARKATS